MTESRPLRLLRLDEVKAITGLADTTIWRYEKAGAFPRRRQIGPNRTAWLLSEIEDWVAGLAPLELGEKGNATTRSQ